MRWPRARRVGRRRPRSGSAPACGPYLTVCRSTPLPERRTRPTPSAACWITRKSWSDPKLWSRRDVNPPPPACDERDQLDSVRRHDGVESVEPPSVGSTTRVQPVIDLMKAFRLRVGDDAAALDAPVEVAALRLHHRPSDDEKGRHLCQSLLFGHPVIPSSPSLTAFGRVNFRGFLRAVSTTSPYQLTTVIAWVVPGSMRSRESQQRSACLPPSAMNFRWPPLSETYPSTSSSLAPSRTICEGCRHPVSTSLRDRVSHDDARARGQRRERHCA
jgi:hypothetical protein